MTAPDPTDFLADDDQQPQLVPIDAPSGLIEQIEEQAAGYIAPAVERAAAAAGDRIKHSDDPTVLMLATHMVIQHHESGLDGRELLALYVQVRRLQTATEVAIEYLRSAGVDDLVCLGPVEVDGYQLSYNAGGQIADLKALKAKDPSKAELFEAMEAAQQEASSLKKQLTAAAKAAGCVAPVRSSVALGRPKTPKP